MTHTLVIQSHRSPLPYVWLEQCLESVRRWCEFNQYNYQFIGDELFDSISEELQEKVGGQIVIATDLARLSVLQGALNKGYKTVIWLDTDFLIFDSKNFVIPNEDYAVGREVWVQKDGIDKLKFYKKVHNAFLMFRQDNGFLKFYKETAERLLQQNEGGMPPQFIGPKLLTALHNIAQLPVMEAAGMLSPLVIKDINNGGGDALQCFIKHSSSSVHGVNLCISSRDRGDITCREMEQAISTLLNDGLQISGKLSS